MLNATAVTATLEIVPDMEISASAGSDSIKEPPDTELIERINTGDAAAFEVLYRRHRDWVVGLAFRFTGDHALALDVMQETFLYLLGKCPGLNLRARLRTMLYPAVRHLALAALEKAHRCQGPPEWLDERPAPTNATSASVQDETLRAVLRMLPGGHGEVLRLRFVEGFKLEEIAAAMELPLGTVKSRLHHALQVLRKDSRTREYFAA